MLGDYYPLTPYNLSEDKWIAWQFNRPEHGDGMVQAFRRSTNEETGKSLRLRGLDPSAEYEVTDLDIATPKKVSGRELMEQGLSVEIKTRPGSSMVIYKKAQ
jgi:alpha-galactosidase